MRRSAIVLSLLLALGPLAGCFTMHSTVGKGPQGRGTVEKRLWYCIFGLVPLGDHPDVKQLAGGATDYRATTEVTAVDFIIGIFTSVVTIRPMTVRVEK